MATCLISLLLLLGLSSALVSCTCALLMWLARCVSNGANNIDYFQEKMEAEERMILRMEDYVVQTNLTSEQPARAKAA